MPPLPAEERGRCFSRPRLPAEAGPLLQAAPGLSHPGKTSPTGLIPHGFSCLSLREHLNSGKVTIRWIFCSSGTPVQSSTRLQSKAAAFAHTTQEGNQPHSGAARSSLGHSQGQGCPKGGDSSAVSPVTGSGQGKCGWHALTVRSPQLLSRICTHPNTGIAQGAAGIEPLDGAIVKELGFVFQTPSRTCPGSAGSSWSALPWSDTLRQEVGVSGMQRCGRRDGSPTESVRSWRWEKVTNFHS